MQIKSRYFISYSLILFLIISGIWFSILQPDSLSEDIRKDASDMHFFGFSYISVNNISPYTRLRIDFFDGEQSVRSFCTTENICYPFWRIYEETCVVFPALCGKAVLLRYMQNQDGKKQYLQPFAQAENLSEMKNIESIKLQIK